MVTEFSNRRTPPTDEDFACAPGINPGTRQADWQYMDEDLQEAYKTPEKAPAAVPTPAKARKAPARAASAQSNPRKKLTQIRLFDF